MQSKFCPRFCPSIFQIPAIPSAAVAFVGLCVASLSSSIDSFSAESFDAVLRVCVPDFEIFVGQRNELVGAKHGVCVEKECLMII